MAYRLMGEAATIVDDIDGTEKLALIILANYANEQGCAWPSLPTIAQQVRISKRQAIRVLARLEARGLIVIEKSRGRMRSNRYQLVVDALEKVSPVSPPTEEKVTSTSPLTTEKVTPMTSGPELSTGAKVTSTTGKGVTGVTQVVTPMSPDPISDPVRTKNKNSPDGMTRVAGLAVEILRRPLAKLTHSVMDKLGEGALVSDVSDELKAQCAKFGWRLEPSVIAAAIESARVQRQLCVNGSHDGASALDGDVQRAGRAAR